MQLGLTQPVGTLPAALGQGTGLGLSISYQIVTETHGGKLQYRSTPQQGTTSMLDLPLSHLHKSHGR